MDPSPSANNSLLPMKTRLPSLLATLGLLSFPATAPAQYVLDWFTLDGGGGTSTNQTYSLTGTIGQPDAGRLSGAGFTLEGGFWGLATAVPTPGAPGLSVCQVQDKITVTWPAPAPGWVLERARALSDPSAPWTPVPPPYSNVGGTNTVTFLNSPPLGNWFFRLRHP